MVFAYFSVEILSLFNFDSVCVIRNKLAASSSLPILSKISSLYLKPFLFAISLTVSPLYSPLYSELWNLSKFFTPALFAVWFKE